MMTFLKVFSLCVVIALSLVLNTTASIVSTGDYNKDFHVYWNDYHVNTSGLIRTLMMDQASGGSGFCSNDKFLFGQFDMQMMLIKGKSGGTIATFYLQSDQTNKQWDEIDFEFLGPINGKPYSLQTNIFTNGTGKREQKTYLWFDPTEGFHTYSIFWNIYQIVFKVNDVPIRTYRNHMADGVEYPIQQPMNLFASLWNGPWAGPIDWSQAPFIVSYRKYKTDACIWEGDAKACGEFSPSNWFNNVSYGTLTGRERALLKWARKTYLYYDYCEDTYKFNGVLPKECNLSMY